MTLAFDLPICQPSFLERLDPRWKLAALLFAGLATALVRTPGPALLACVGALLLVGAAHVPWSWYLRRLSAATLLYVLLLIWLPFVVAEGDATLDCGWFILSTTRLVRLGVLSANLVTMISLVLVVLATTPLPSVFKAARALWLPRLLVLLLLLTCRYIFLVVDEFVRLRTALRVRGFRNRANLHSYRTIGQAAGTLLVRASERSERVAQAMRCRGFAGEFRTLNDFRTRPADVLAFVLIVGYAASLATWDWLDR